MVLNHFPPSVLGMIYFSIKDKFCIYHDETPFCLSQFIIPTFQNDFLNFNSIINHISCSSQIGGMHKFYKWVFYFYSKNWLSHSTTINLFPKGWDFLPHSCNFPFFLDPEFYSFQSPGSILLSPALSVISSLFPLHWCYS